MTAISEMEELLARNWGDPRAQLLAVRKRWPLVLAEIDQLLQRLWTAGTETGPYLPRRRQNPWADPQSRAAIMHGMRLAARKRRRAHE